VRFLGDGRDFPVDRQRYRRYFLLLRKPPLGLYPGKKRWPLNKIIVLTFIFIFVSQGQCKTIGCDKRLDSVAKENECGVCNGKAGDCTAASRHYSGAPRPRIIKSKSFIFYIAFDIRFLYV